MITRYRKIDTVAVTTLEKNDIIEWDGFVYTVDLNVLDEGFRDIAVCVTDEMDDADILWLPADADVDLLTEDFS